MKVFRSRSLNHPNSPPKIALLVSATSRNEPSGRKVLNRTVLEPF